MITWLVDLILGTIVFVVAEVGSRMTRMELCWWCRERTDLGTYHLDGARLCGVPMIAPPGLSERQRDEIRLCWGCLEAFATMVERSEDEYREHVIRRAGKELQTIVRKGRGRAGGSMSVGEALRRYVESLGRDASA